jgi:hypothetical protein
VNKVGRELIQYQGRIWLSGYLKLREASADERALAVSDDYIHVYAKNSGGNARLYFKDEADVEHEVAITSAIITDHGGLTGLTDDDHTQYLKEKASGGVAAEVPEHTHADAANAGTIDHGAITGLTDDDHTQYVMRSILTTNGDIFIRSGGVIARLGIGSEGQVLTVTSGAPAWADATGGSGSGGEPVTNGDATNPELIFADGDVIVA